MVGKEREVLWVPFERERESCSESVSQSKLHQVQEEGRKQRSDIIIVRTQQRVDATTTRQPTISNGIAWCL